MQIYSKFSFSTNNDVQSNPHLASLAWISFFSFFHTQKCEKFPHTIVHLFLLGQKAMKNNV